MVQKEWQGTRVKNSSVYYQNEKKRGGLVLSPRSTDAIKKFNLLTCVIGSLIVYLKKKFRKKRT